MKGFIVVILYCAICTFVMSNELLNEKYSLYEPKSELSDIEISSLYKDFLLAYKDQQIDNIIRAYNHYSVFNENVKKIVKHNSDPLNTWKQGINQFTDMTDEEFTQVMLMKAYQNCSATEGTFKLTEEELAEPQPLYKDWREQGVVSIVKNQGKCGSCWTFSTTGSLEAHFAIYTNTSPRLLSEQQLLDCAGNFDNNGCHGGLPSHAFEYIKYAGGIDTEWSYKYEAKENGCRFDKAHIGAVVKGGSVNITAGNDEELTQAIAKVGPVSVAFQATKEFRNYARGVWDPSDCSNGPMDVNHAVLAVGYGTLDGKDYYLIKNSWGEGWGESGYFKIARGKNACGISTCASYPDIYGNSTKA